jgi:hypothetical protein
LALPCWRISGRWCGGASAYADTEMKARDETVVPGATRARLPPHSSGAHVQRNLPQFARRLRSKSERSNNFGFDCRSIKAANFSCRHECDRSLAVSDRSNTSFMIPLLLCLPAPDVVRPVHHSEVLDEQSAPCFGIINSEVRITHRAVWPCKRLLVTVRQAKAGEHVRDDHLRLVAVSMNFGPVVLMDFGPPSGV